MSKLRLDYFLSLGLRLVQGDIFRSPVCDKNLTVDEGMMEDDEPNDEWDRNNECFVISFAPRKNEGAIPCAGHIPVITTMYNGEDYIPDVACCWGWSTVYAHAKGLLIKEWKPSLEGLIKMQDEHDAKISGKERDLSYFTGPVGNVSDQELKPTYTQTMKDAGELPRVGMLCLMNLHSKWGEVEIVHATGRKVCAYSKVHEDYYATSYMKFKPVDPRTPEQKQVDDILKTLRDTKMMKFNRKFTCDMLLIMQKAGLLAEIVLPLEG